MPARCQCKTPFNKAKNISPGNSTLYIINTPSEMSSNTHKQLTLVEMLKNFMQNKQALNGAPKATKAAASSIRPQRVIRKRVLCSPKRDATTRVAGPRKRPRGQLSIKDIFHATSDSSTSNVNSTDEYAEFIRPLLRPKQSSLANANDRYNYDMAPSDSPDSGKCHTKAAKSSHLKDKSDEVIIISDITLCGPNITPAPQTASPELNQPETGNNAGNDSVQVIVKKAPNNEANLVPLLVPIREFSSVNRILNCLVKDSYTATAARKGYIVHCKDTLSYNKLRQYLHSKKNKQNIPIARTPYLQFIIHKLSKTTPTTWILQQLTKLGYDITDVQILINPASGKRLNMFKIKLIHCDDSTIDSITSLKTLANHTISIEIYKSSTKAAAITQARNKNRHHKQNKNPKIITQETASLTEAVNKLINTMQRIIQVTNKIQTNYLLSRQ